MQRHVDPLSRFPCCPPDIHVAAADVLLPGEVAVPDARYDAQVVCAVSLSAMYVYVATLSLASE